MSNGVRLAISTSDNGGDQETISQASNSPSRMKPGSNFGDRLFMQRTVSFRSKEITPISATHHGRWERGLRDLPKGQSDSSIPFALASMSPEMRDTIMNSPANSGIIK